MFETVVTVVGRVVGELTRRRTGDDIPVVSFRMLAQERRINRETGEWSNGDSMFLGPLLADAGTERGRVPEAR